MEKIFVVVAMLMNIETSDITPKTHEWYAFDNGSECMAFVTCNYMGLYVGLQEYLDRIGDKSKIIEIGCGEISKQEWEDRQNTPSRKDTTIEEDLGTSI